MTPTLHNCTETFFNCKEEEDFLFSFLKPDMEVLEWGSGSSTIAIAKRVKEIVSIEHDIKYYNKFINTEYDDNIKLIHVQRNQVETSGHDGTYEDYRNYINFPVSLNQKFDLIFIDGRSRVECAKVAVSLLKENGVILIHDYRNPNPACDRPEYHVVEQFLDVIDFQYALYAFKPKK